MDINPQIIIALDVPSADDIPPILAQLPDRIEWYKVGLELFTSDGPSALEPLQAAGKRIFLDLKLHDIPNTVARAVHTAAHHGVAMLTLHATGGSAMLRLAAEAAAEYGDQAPALLAVTTLTSLDQQDLDDVGVARPLADHSLALARLAIDAGIDGIVTSVHEAQALRRALGPGTLLVTPGIRPGGADHGDQKRVATPATAVQAGATHLVVGRAILNAEDPGAAAENILAEIDNAGK